jgi:hypothetical protein
VLSSAPYSIGDEGRVATQEDVDLYGDRALLSFLTLEHRAFLACQRTSLAVRVIVLAIFFVPLGVINPIDASWLYSWLAFYVCLEVIAVLSERSATKKVQQRLASLIKYGSKHRLLRLSEVTELPLVEIGRRPGADFGEVLYVGSAVGAAVSQLLERWLAALISPMSRRTKRYLTLVELALARGKGTLSEVHANALREKAQNEYFHDDTASRAKGRLRTRFEIE